MEVQDPVNKRTAFFKERMKWVYSVSVWVASVSSAPVEQAKGC